MIFFQILMTLILVVGTILTLNQGTVKGDVAQFVFLMIQAGLIFFIWY